MREYTLILLADVLLAIYFSVVKVYQKREGISIRKSLIFNMLLGLAGALMFGAMQGFRIEISLYSVLMAGASAILCTLYTILGFRIMSGEKMAMYTIFLMCGGMIVPYIWGVTFLGETLTVLRVLGLLTIVAAVALTNVQKGMFDRRILLLCCTVFLLNGFVSVVSKEHQIHPNAVSSNSFLVVNNLVKAILCAIAICFSPKEKGNAVPLSLPSGLLVLAAAALNGISYLFQLMGAATVQASVLYSLITGGTIFFSVLAGRIFFKESVTTYAKLGIVLCMAGTCMFL